MTDAANLDGIGFGADEEEPVVPNPQPKLFSSLERFHIARTDSAKRNNAERTCIAVGLLRLRTSILEGSVQTIRFTSVPERGRSLPA
jgi:hypothetical protein